MTQSPRHQLRLALCHPSNLVSHLKKFKNLMKHIIGNIDTVMVKYLVDFLGWREYTRLYLKTQLMTVLLKNADVSFLLSFRCLPRFHHPLPHLGCLKSHQILSLEVLLPKLMAITCQQQRIFLKWFLRHHLRGSSPLCLDLA